MYFFSIVPLPFSSFFPVNPYISTLTPLQFTQQVHKLVGVPAAEVAVVLLGYVLWLRIFEWIRRRRLIVDTPSKNSIKIQGVHCNII